MEMNTAYKLFFGFEKDPFTADIAVDEILKTSQLNAAEHRFAYAVGLGAVYLITGEIGSGKSTAIRYLLPALRLGSVKDLIRYNKLSMGNLIMISNLLPSVNIDTS